MPEIDGVIKIGRALEDLDEQHTKLSWVLYTTGFDFGIDAVNKGIARVYGSKKDYDTILNHQQKKLKPLDQRRVDIIARAFRPYHFSKKANALNLRIQEKQKQLVQILNSFRYKLNNRELRSTDIFQLLKSDPDRQARKEAFLALSQVNQPLVDAGFVDLIKMRHELAESCGAKNFVEYKLEYDELPPSIFNGWREEAQKQIPNIRETQALFGEKYLGDPTVMPWDNAFIDASLAPQLNQFVDMSKFYHVLRNTFSIFGFDIGRHNIIFDVFPRRHKSEWGYFFPIKKGKEVRILANVANRYHEYFALLHETGHALHYLLIDPEDVLLNMGISGIIQEGFAILWNDLLYERIFYEQFFKKDIIEADAAFERLKIWQRARKIEAVFNVLFDQALYLNEFNTLADIGILYWRLRKDIFNQKPYTDNPPWGYVPHCTIAPIYLHTGLLGNVTNDMLRRSFTKTTGIKNYWEKPIEFGQFVFEKVVKPSGAYPYLELCERISGEPFSLNNLNFLYGDKRVYSR